MATVLLVESTRANGSSFAPHLKKRYSVMLAHTGKTALSLVKNQVPDVMVVDSTLMRTSGNRICALLRGQAQEVPIIHIKEMILEDSEENESIANLLLHPPLTYRKLYNRIERYVASANEEHTLKIGNIKLSLEQGLLTMPQGEQKLTPKLAQLLGVFMRQAGQIVDRRQLIKEVWQTDYMGDTRTLDVHIRWLRQMLEEKPGSPQILKTVRGKGYIFQPPR
jgi:DNA-binding response OmpR family regulator